MNIFYKINKTDIMQLIDMGPVSSVIISDTNFQYYKSNVFSCDYTYNDNMVNHAVQVIGYNATGNYYIIKNSWGTGWGMSGFGYVDMDKDCYISRAIYQMVSEFNLVFIVALFSVIMMIL